MHIKEVLQTLPAQLLHRLCQGLSHQVRHRFHGTARCIHKRACTHIAPFSRHR